MSYARVLYYADVVEVTQYERHPAVRRTKRQRGENESDSVQSHISFDGSDATASGKPPKIRTETDVKRAVLAFRRLCITNIARFGNPVWASFTYRDNMADVAKGRKDWNAFAKRAKAEFGDGFRYICVAEFQRRGALHFHAFLWGIPASVVEVERSTRLVARLWGQGFSDLVSTDGSHKMATYMSKYAGKHFADPRLNGHRCYIASKNIARPILDRGAVLGMYFNGDIEGLPDLSTGVVLHESEYETHYLGRANYKKYKLLRPYA